MSDNITVEISIPCDDEGYVLLRCSHCGELFKITASDAKDDEVLDIYCPACGLTSESYLTDDVIALANAKINKREFDRKNQSTRHKIPFGISEEEQIEGFFGKKE